MNTILTVWAKELRDFVRDRRTMLMALLFGPLLTPALMIGLITMGEHRAKEQSEKPLEIVMTGAERAPNLVAWLAGQGINAKTIDEDPDAAIRNQDEDVYLHIGTDYAKDWQAGKPALVEIVRDTTRQDSSIPAQRLQAALAVYGQQVGALRLLARGVNPGVAAPLAVSQKDLSTPAARRGVIMAILPYLFILSAFLGGAYLVIDITAGERERQSLEPMLATPASRAGIVSGKILASCSVGLTSLLLTLLALKLGAQFAPGVARTLDVSFATIGTFLIVLLPMLFIGNTLLTCIAAGAKSVKEAQSYMTVLMLLPMVPTVMLMVNPVRTQLWQFAVPFLAQNQMLLKVIRAEAVTPLMWLIYFGAGFALAAVLWLASIQRYRQEKLAISA